MSRGWFERPVLRLRSLKVKSCALSFANVTLIMHSFEQYQGLVPLLRIDPLLLRAVPR